MHADNISIVRANAMKHGAIDVAIICDRAEKITDKTLEEYLACWIDGPVPDHLRALCGLAITISPSTAMGLLDMNPEAMLGFLEST